jgi:2-methylcitrate dehydratase
VSCTSVLGHIIKVYGDSMDEVTTKLAQFTVGIKPRQLSSRVRREVGRRLIDTLACGYAALETEPVRALRSLAVTHELENGCAVWGGGFRTTPEMAAIVNGAAVRFLDQNDYTVGGHPSDNIPAIVAACEWNGGSVDDLVAGVVVNYEVFGELGRLLIRYRGWDQGTTAVIAAACAVGRVTGLAEPEVGHAIGMVATGNIATGKVRRGHLSMWKGVAGPYASACALTAVAMAKAGISAPHDAFAGEFGFFEQVSGPFEIERLNLAQEPWYLFQAGYKHFPVQFDAQAAVWLGQKIRARLANGEIERIEVETSEWTWKGIANDPTKWAPSNRETADHSLPFILAVALSTGGITADDFSMASISNPLYGELMATIQVSAAEDITAASRENCTMRAVVRTKNGGRYDFEVSEPRSKPMTEEELDEKWRKLVSPTPLAERADELHSALRLLDGNVSVRELMDPLTTAM